MTKDEFKQIMSGANYEVNPTFNTEWLYKKGYTSACFRLIENRRKDTLTLDLEIYSNCFGEIPLGEWHHTFENVSQMNSIEFKKKLEGMTDYAYSLYMDINRHIDALTTKLETKAKRLGM